MIHALTAWNPRLCTALRQLAALAFLSYMDNSTFLASFFVLTVLYAAAWIVLSKLMRARAPMKCDSEKMPDQAATLAR